MATEQEKQFFKQSFTLQGRVFHPVLLSPRAKRENEQPKFSVMFAWLKNSQVNAETMQKITQFLEAAKQTFHPGIPRIIEPIKDFDTYQREDGKGNPEYVRGHFWVNASSGEKFQPVVVDQARQPVMNEADIYSGRNAVMNITFYNMNGQKGGKRGIGVNISAVMLLEGGAAEGGAAQVDPNTVFGNFQADMGLAQQGNTSMAQNGQVAPQAPAQNNPYQAAPQAPAPQHNPYAQVPQANPAPQAAPAPAPQYQPPQAPAQTPQAPAQNNPFAPQAPAQDQQQQQQQQYTPPTNNNPYV